MCDGLEGVLAVLADSVICDWSEGSIAVFGCSVVAILVGRLGGSVLRSVIGRFAYYDRSLCGTVRDWLEGLLAVLAVSVVRCVID